MPDIPASYRTAGRWAVRICRLGEEPRDDLSDVTTVAERLAMVAELSRRMWELTGRPNPSYDRWEMPVRIVHQR